MGRRALRGTSRHPVDSGTAELLPDGDLRDGWILLVDGTQQSHVDLAHPDRLVFEYMRRIGHVIDLLPAGPVRAVHLGGGAMTLARYLSATRPRSRNLVIERDAALVELVRSALPWPRTHQIRVRTADARTALESLPDAGADLLVLDVFASARTPGNLTSIEAFGHAHRVVGPTGTLVANIADEASLAYARRYVAGVAATFDRVAVAAEPSTLRGRRFGNLIVVGQPASAPALDIAVLTRRCASDPWPARLVHGPALAQFVAGARPYRDADAPGSPEPPPGMFGGNPPADPRAGI
ncbi:MAG: fused MFS/spermidine synthase [Candidatus Nanopelagicales bacterium]